jgi:hypothetical protein
MQSHSAITDERRSFSKWAQFRKTVSMADDDSAFFAKQPIFRRPLDSRQAGLPDGLFSSKKIPIWLNFGGPYNGKYLYIFDPF